MKSFSIRGLLAVARRHRHAAAAAKATSVPALLALLLFLAAAATFSVLSFRSPGGVAAAVAACDAALAHGEWVRDAGEAVPAYYTNATCSFIQDYQNCMKHGRPSTEFLRWRWRPSSSSAAAAGCGGGESRFDAARFLRLVRGKSMLFVGDSLASSHVTSLMCALSRIESPSRSPRDAAGFEHWRFPAHGFAVAYYWTPFQVRWRLTRGPPDDFSVGPDRQGEVFAGPTDIHLDVPDSRWTTAAREHDHVIISASHWFARPAVYYRDGHVIGCHDCGDNATVAGPAIRPEAAQRAAFRTVLRAVARLDGFNGTAILRTVAPTHYENGGWFDGGECTATRPVGDDDSDEAPEMAAREAEFYRAQVEEFAAAAAAEARLRLMDVTRMMLLRPDGHPDRYGHGDGEHDGFEIDCLHWCLPGAIDVWNELLLQMLEH